MLLCFVFFWKADSSCEARTLRSVAVMECRKEASTGTVASSAGAPVTTLGMDDAFLDEASIGLNAAPLLVNVSNWPGLIEASGRCISRLCMSAGCWSSWSP